MKHINFEGVGVMMRTQKMIKAITQEEVKVLGLKGKPKCPACHKPLTYVCGDVSGGHLNQKCGNCGRYALVDMMTMEALPIEQETAS